MIGAREMSSNLLITRERVYHMPASRQPQDITLFESRQGPSLYFLSLYRGGLEETRIVSLGAGHCALLEDCASICRTATQTHSVDSVLV